jgi:NAD(P)-dependent dehydrogenase (short-subunit alcohol dehydrogenase family)
VGSATCHIGAAGMGAYCASKHAVLGLTKSAAREHTDVRINLLCPGTWSHYSPSILREADDLSRDCEYENDI